MLRFKHGLLCLSLHLDHTVAMASTSKKTAADDEISSFRELNDNQTFTTLRDLIQYAKKKTAGATDGQDDSGSFSCLLTNVEEVPFLDQKTNCTNYLYRMVLWHIEIWGQEPRARQDDAIVDSGDTIDC